MTETRYNALVKKIFWFSLPLVIGLLTFLVVNTYYVKEEVAKVAVKNEAAIDMQNKMWELLQVNNTILNSKADQAWNEESHKEIIKKLEKIESDVGRLYVLTKQEYSMKKDTINDTIPYKIESFLTENKK